MAEKKILLSIIVPFLNASEDVEGLFKSLAAQTGVDKKSIEIIVVNDGSTDDTQQKVERLSILFKNFGGLQTLVHKKRTGQVEARLDAANVAKGKFLVFVDKRTRPDADYFEKLLNIKRNIVIGNVYMKKDLSPWDRVLALVRKKLYFPYFNHPFDDFELDKESYRLFKIKGGGGALLVLREYYLQIADKFKKGKDVSDDSMLIGNLLKIEPLVKTAAAKTLYLNRTGFRENVNHLFNRGPKFVDYYIKPGTRFFPAIIGLLILAILNLAAFIFAPLVMVYELIAAVALLIILSSYLSEELLDFITCLWLFPIIFVAFVAGICKGLAMKALRLY